VTLKEEQTKTIAIYCANQVV